MITLQYESTTLTLHPDLFWDDENDWHPVVQSAQRSITGAMIVSAKALTGGRPITLRPIDDSSAWMSRSTLDVLRSWAAAPGRTMTLTLRGASRSVIFRHHDGAGVEASPLVHYSDVDGADYYSITLRFMEI